MREDHNIYYLQRDDVLIKRQKVPKMPKIIKKLILSDLKLKSIAEILFRKSITEIKQSDN